jgi:uncharacterized protein with HEPN domain
MSERSTQVLIEDISEALGKIFKYSAGMTENAFLENELVSDAILRNIEVMGEAATQLPDSFIDEHPEIEWHKIIGMRNRLIHGYFGVSLKIVWQTIQVSLPDLQDKLFSL